MFVVGIRHAYQRIGWHSAMDDAQQTVSEFLTTHDLECPPEYRLLDLVAEVGELTANATESTDYGATPDSLSIDPDELGDVLFAAIALAESQSIDANDALVGALEKYERRIETTGSAGSGE